MTGCDGITECDGATGGDGITENGRKRMEMKENGRKQTENDGEYLSRNST